MPERLHLAVAADELGIGGNKSCTLTGTWWLDLDAANSGVFKGKPLAVVLEGGEAPATIENYGRVTLSVVMQKK